MQVRPGDALGFETAIQLDLLYSLQERLFSLRGSEMLDALHEALYNEGLRLPSDTSRIGEVDGASSRLAATR